MSRPPRQIGGADVILFTPIDRRHRPTGACRHSAGGAPAGPAAGIAICRYEGDPGFYLFGCDADWNCVTDTWHERLDEAIEQAEFECEGARRTLQRIP